MSEMGKYILLPLLVLLNPFHVNAPFLYPLKTAENQRFSDIFRGYKNGKLASKGLTSREIWDEQSVTLFLPP